MNAPESQVSKLIFVGGLSADTTAEQIQTYLGAFTEVLSVKIAQDRKLKQSKGYALVKVPAEVEVDQLLKTRHNINSRRVDIQLAAKRSEKQQWKDELKKRKVFVKDILPEVTNEEFEAFIATVAGVKSGYIIRDYHTQESKGYGYIEFFTDEQTASVLQKGLSLHGKPLSVMPYKYKYEPKGPTEENSDTRPLSDDGLNCSTRPSSGENFVRTDSPREKGDEAITMKVDGHGNSSSNSATSKGSAQTPAIVVRRKLEHLKVCGQLNESLQNLRFNGWTHKPYPILF